MENMEASNYQYDDIEDNYEENIDNFDKFEKRVKNFKETLDTLKYQKNKKIDFLADKKLLADEIGNELYQKLHDIKSDLILDLNISNVEKTCHSLNELLKKNSYFLRIYEQKKKNLDMLLTIVHKRKI